jgi:hypothetical protein
MIFQRPKWFFTNIEIFLHDDIYKIHRVVETSECTGTWVHSRMNDDVLRRLIAVCVER